MVKPKRLQLAKFFVGKPINKAPQEVPLHYGQFALITAALFSGAALYVNVCEQPARLLLEDQPLLTEWKAAYKRGTLMQAPLAMAGFLLGLLALWESGNLAWLVGGLLMLANWPFTIFVIMPTNQRLIATEFAGRETRSMIMKWARLHGVRTALGIGATVTFLAASL